MKELSLSLENIKAESFLSVLQDSIAETNIEFEGVFTRNFLDDILDYKYYTFPDKNQFEVRLSRDGLFHLLPEGLFFKEELLKKVEREKNKEKFRTLCEKIRKEKQKIRLFFQPFDKTYFNLRFELEKKLNETAADRTQLLTNELFDIFTINRENHLIEKIIPILPLASEIRSNRMIWRDVLRNVFYPAKVEVRIAQKRNTSGNMTNIVKATIHIEELSNSHYKNIKKDVDVFAQFFYEWFLPADMRYAFKIKDTKQTFILGSEMTLDYNTYLS